MTQPTVKADAPARADATISFLSVAAPAYNEAAGIAEVVRRWTAYLHDFPGVEKFEIVICNDGSSDGTGAQLDDLCRHAPELRPIHLKHNRGAAAALSTAIRQTQGDWVLLIDSDDQFPISNLPALLEAVQPRGLASIGIRAAKQDNLFARFGSWSSGWLCNWFHGTHCGDFNSALKLVHGPLLRSLTLEAKGLNYSTEITSKLLERGVPLAEVEATHLPRRHGKSSLKAVRGALHRFLFVFYIGYRQLLFRLRILERPSAWS